MASSATADVSMRPSRFRRWLLRLCLVVFGVVVVIGGVEGAGRFYIWCKYGVPGKSYGLWQADSVLGAVHSDNAYNTQTVTNNYGFRGGEDVFEPKPSNSSRVICYGGSMTFCYNLNDAETWPQQLQNLLRARPGHEQDQVLNGGCIVWATGHLHERAKRDMPLFKPDYVVIYSGVNELTNAQCLIQDGYNLGELEREHRYGVFATNYSQCRWLMRNSVIIRFLEYRIKKNLGAFAGQDLTPAVREAFLDLKKPRSDEEFEKTWVWKNYKHEVFQFIELIKEHGGTPVFVIEAGLPDDDKNKRSNHLRFGSHIAPLLRAAGVAVCDPRPALLSPANRNDLFYETGVHVSAAGAKILAQEIAKCIDHLSKKTD